MISHSTRQTLIALLDLTSLSDNDSNETITTLCHKTITPFGKVAAVCVYPQFVNLAKFLLQNQNIAIATVANFPTGNQPLLTILQQLQQATLDGADEIDVVMPYTDFLQGNKQKVLDYLSTVRTHLNSSQRLKIILETGAYHHADEIISATQYAIAAGAHFVKTSTGKIAMGATPEAVEIILKTIKATNKNDIGLKISGGVREVKDALLYLQLVEKIMGPSWIHPKNLRIGASKLLDEILGDNP